MCSIIGANMITPTTEQLSVDDVVYELRRTANNKQRDFDYNGLFWSIIIGMIIGTMFAVSYAMFH